jgi:methionyl aminopeptidase
MIIEKKTPAQLALMRKAGLIVYEAHQAARSLIKPGTTTAEIDAIVEKVIRGHNADPLFKGHRVPGVVPFPACACVSVNEEIVHGIPGPRALKDGDIVSVDIGVRYQGWCGDAAVTWPVGEISAEARKLLDICEGTLRLAIKKMKANIVWNKVARVMESNVKNAGFAVVEDLCGHGIGQQMWESPQVPNYFSPLSGDFKLQAGMVVAIEPMVAIGTKNLKVLDDGWTYVTADSSLAAHFEHTIAITEDGVQVMTAGPDGKAWAID